MSGTETISNEPKIQRVLPLLLQLEKNKDDYLPEAASFGPYHHGEPKLALVEAFKPRAVDLFTSGNDQQNTQFYYDNILEIIEEVRNCYEQDDCIAKCNDRDLAQMMLRDASLIITIMGVYARHETQHVESYRMLCLILEHLGMLAFTVLWRDLILLDNQIPLRVVKLLVDLRYGEGEYKKLLYSFMRDSIFRKYSKEPAKSSKNNHRKREPLHLLEAFHRLVVKSTIAKKKGDDDQETGVANNEEDDDLETGVANNEEDDKIYPLAHSFRTVKDLKANGIFFKPSPTRSLKDVNFRSHFFYARLELPEWFVTVSTKTFFRNMVAFELSPNNTTRWEVVSYINLMKSLIEGPDDVKELRERRILFNKLGSDEEVLNVYKGINTYGADNYDVFKEVKDQIEAHYNSSVKRWMAELFHNNFRSPWTVIAFLAAFTVLAIAAGQLYYAMHPPN